MGVSELPFHLLKEWLAFSEASDQDVPVELTVQYLDGYVLMANHCFLLLNIYRVGQ